MNVKVFRLNSGEEILARFEEKDNSITLKDPAILIPVGEGQIGLMPWMMYTKAAKGVTSPKSFIAFIVEPLEELFAGAQKYVMPARHWRRNNWLADH